MRRRKDRLAIITAWVVGIFLGVSALYLNATGAELETKIGLTQPACSLRVLVYIGTPPVISDSSGWWENIQNVDTTVTYTAGDYVQRFGEMKYGCSDSMILWEMQPFNNTSALSKGDVWDTVWGSGSTYRSVDSNRTEQGGAGTGPYTLKYYCFDTTGAGMVPVEDVLITSKNWGLSSTIRQDRTDANGLVTFQSNSDSLATLAVAPLYVFPLAWDSTTNAGTRTDTLLGYLNVPASAPGVDAVAIYLDATGGLVDSSTGAVIPRDRLSFKLSLICGLGCNDGGWAIFPKTEIKTPNADGRVIFRVWANTPLSPSGSYYSLSYTAKDGRSVFSGRFKKFVVDTLTDPINILDCTEVD